MNFKFCVLCFKMIKAWIKVGKWTSVCKYLYIAVLNKKKKKNIIIKIQIKTCFLLLVFIFSFLFSFFYYLHKISFTEHHNMLKEINMFNTYICIKRTQKNTWMKSTARLQKLFYLEYIIIIIIIKHTTEHPHKIWDTSDHILLFKGVTQFWLTKQETQTDIHIYNKQQMCFINIPFSQ